MDVKRLGYFVRIAELGSLSAAAERLHVSQPSLSRQMRLLEEELGAKLFSRHRRGVSLTREGEELHGRIGDSLRQIEQALRDLRIGNKEQVSLVLGLPPTVGNVMAGGLARRMADRAPGISLHIVEAYAGHLANAIGKGEIDAALLPGPASEWAMTKWKAHLENLAVEDLLVEDMVLVGAPDALSPESPVDLDRLLSLPLVLPSKENYPGFLRVLEAETEARRGRKLDHSVSADSFHLTRQFVESGLGFAFLPYSAIVRDVETGSLSYAPIQGIEASRQLVLATPPGDADRPDRNALSMLSTVIREEISELVSSGVWQAKLLF